MAEWPSGEMNGARILDPAQSVQKTVGGVDLLNVPQTFPQHQPPRDPLAGQSKRQTSLVYADLPLTQTVIDWNVDQIKHALWSHNIGVFWQSGMLADSILGDALSRLAREREAVS